MLEDLYRCSNRQWRNRDGRTLLNIDWSGDGVSDWASDYLIYQPYVKRAGWPASNSCVAFVRTSLPSVACASETNFVCNLERRARRMKRTGLHALSSPPIHIFAPRRFVARLFTRLCNRRDVPTQHQRQRLPGRKDSHEQRASKCKPGTNPVDRLLLDETLC